MSTNTEPLLSDESIMRTHKTGKPMHQLDVKAFYAEEIARLRKGYQQAIDALNTLPQTPEVIAALSTAAEQGIKPQQK